MFQPLTLIIEDQPNLAMLYEDTLRLVGYNIIVIRDGLEGLNYLKTHDLPDFLILDVNLPSLSGHEILQQLRSSDRYDDMPILVLTANTLMLDRIKPEIGENDYLHSKPISMFDLQAYAKKVRKRAKQQPDTPAKSAIATDNEDSPSDDRSLDDTVIKVSDTTMTDEKAQISEQKAIITSDNRSISLEKNQDEAT